VGAGVEGGHVGDGAEVAGVVRGASAGIWRAGGGDSDSEFARGGVGGEGGASADARH